MKQVSVILVLAGFLVGPTALPASANSGADCLTGKGKVAIEGCTQSLKVDKWSDIVRRQIFFKRAAAYASIGDYKNALADYGRVAKMNPKDAVVHFSIGTVMLEQKKYQQAVKAFTTATMLKKDFAAAYKQRAKAYLFWHHNDEAIDAYDEVLAMLPNDVEALSDRGEAYQQLGLFDRAREDFDTAIKRAPADTEIYYRRGISYYNSGFVSKAIKDFDVVLGKNPDHVALLRLRAFAYGQMRNYTKAVENLDAVLAKGGPDPINYNFRAVFKAKAGNLAGATQDFSKACHSAGKAVVGKWQTILTRFGLYKQPVNGVCDQALVTSFETCIKLGCPSRRLLFLK
jgi:tetratricopeptide (TPR) repeat protein